MTCHRDATRARNSVRAHAAGTHESKLLATRRWDIALNCIAGAFAARAATRPLRLAHVARSRGYIRAPQNPRSQIGSRYVMPATYRRYRCRDPLFSVAATAVNAVAYTLALRYIYVHDVRRPG